ncbi:heme ABC exporter ATP-binding protein CcmA [Bradyrhizobium sp. U87765 SZCCT0131]|uniref:heme ABC exporter ATP-binding protein CcmA n=1 Tax=unclassified Bradyrhizobium TaxID=2631580 RepID=UPI001BAA8104|nr:MULTISPECIES: heme ABC exporter ATP-binding protein CcmA [unclassified Bradyrhizobium]MBR1217005.1 heme ABC exporter ATP-binding protein CcmA [Bradyrhizobium sp. U87765 SZCCT0131]MBR1259239.1 heme ABC exporter ATP-binding protein CcmA [Bradyrhizobium sp. U87765 SZCCT0134]MBR1305380.1 heme ABC exporter ATP-binding protein CcmA [Bradyrhizobium sp. U87765 SZCCT0110]MBR1321166.1 heme ABC exporter ATP-binding protein CcmA [Bradyrhizobium sp. U87765 SZCCT0109]MBR1350180.1 heme ABC exporter ATP-bi
MRLSGVGLTCVRGGRQVFSGLDFEVGAGEALAITGHNGAGKSSLLRLIAGLLPAAQGQIVLAGASSGDLTPGEQAHYLGHRDALKPSLTVQENLAFWLDFLGGPPGGLDASLAATGLAHTRTLPAVTLSAGQKRRLSMARLIAVKRPIWLLDEPTSALDTDGQSLIARLMADHLAQGGLVVAATHGPLGIAAREQRIGQLS